LDGGGGVVGEIPSPSSNEPKVSPPKRKSLLWHYVYSSTELNANLDSPCFIAIILLMPYAPHVLLSLSDMVRHGGLAPTT